MDFTAFALYVFVMTFTPGPNNIMSMTIASKHGFMRALPFDVGVFVGFAIILAVCAAFSSVLYDVIPSIEPYMLCLGAAYMLWLAWSVWRDVPHEGGPARTGSMTSAIVLQFVNVKGILYALTTMTSYVLPWYRGLPVLGFVLALPMVALVSTCCWALFGASFERVLKRHGRVLDVIMALLLVWCAVTMLCDVPDSIHGR